MKETQIPFTGEMVLAILEGRKTQTRRLVKKFRIAGTSGQCQGPDGYDTVTDHRIMRVPWDERTIQQIACPYGQPGDWLWVRETWTSGYHNGCFGTIFQADSTFRQGKRQHSKGPHFHAKEIGDHIRWRPSIHMPRWASRLTLEITGVRVERVQQISEEDALAEGIDGWLVKNHLAPPRRLSFKYLWDSLTPKRDFGWEANPWVWVIEFKEVKAGRKSA